MQLSQRPCSQISDDTAPAHGALELMPDDALRPLTVAAEEHAPGHPADETELEAT